MTEATRYVKAVTPVKTGVQDFLTGLKDWIPASAGMTEDSKTMISLNSPTQPSIS